MMQASSSFAVRGGQVFYLDEFQGSPDTETLALAIKAKYWPNFNNPQSPEYKKKICQINVYPDPSGRARKTSAAVGVTDFSILASHGFNVLAGSAHPTIIDSVACVNRMLKNANGATSLYISATCKGLINSLERTSWAANNPDTAAIDKTKGEEHFSDGARYAMMYLFPIRAGHKTASRGFGF